MRLSYNFLYYVSVLMYLCQDVRRALMENTDNQAPCSGLRIGDTAPDFTARSTAGPVTLSDFRGKWVLLFSHPADFTPVCTSEFVALAKTEDQFTALGAQLLALSVDSLYSHFAWVRAIKDRFDTEVRFPIIEDPTLVIGKAYGMVSPKAHDSATVRTNFFIDPAGIVRAMACYPLNIGRSVEEMLRMLTALQEADKTGLLAPEGWQKGDPMLQQPNPDLDDIFSGGEASDWFLTQSDEGHKS